MSSILRRSDTKIFTFVLVLVLLVLFGVWFLNFKPCNLFSTFFVKCAEGPLYKAYPNEPRIAPEYTEPPNVAEAFSLHFISKVVTSHVHLASNNFIISPIAIWALLMTIAEHATGDALHQLCQALRLPHRTHLPDATSLAEEFDRYHAFTKLIEDELLANQLMFSDHHLNDRILDLYKELLQYNIDHSQIDFKCPNGATEIINGYADYTSNNLIGNSVEAADLSGLDVLLLSTVYSKRMFQKTIVLPYQNENGEIVGMRWAQQRGNFPLITMDELNARVLMLPYDDNDRLSMLIFLPLDRKLNDIFIRLKDVTIEKILLKMYENHDKDWSIGVAMPMFSINSAVNLLPVLRKMGIKEKFAKKNMGYKTGIFHKVKIELQDFKQQQEAQQNEEQIETELVLSDPFSFLIVERHTKIVLLAGQVQNPFDN